MHWDDLQLLKWIDDKEQELAYTGNGLNLLDELARRHEFNRHEETGGFAIELELARNAGFLTWVDRSTGFVGRFGPRNDPNMWLQTIDDVRLTIAGRDRARGRVVVVELTDPSEDDGRFITGLTMREIAKTIGATYSAAQLPRYLRESGIPRESVPEAVVGEESEYVFNVLDTLHEGGSAARRSLREFIGGWLDGWFHAPPPTDVRKHITSLLAQQGWHIRDGRLVIGERVRVEVGTVSPLGRDARLAALHSTVRLVSEHYPEGQLNVAIFEAFKAVNNRVKEMTQLDLDGAKLMDAALGSSNPRILFGDLTTRSGRDIQQGFHFMFRGAVQGIRNPHAHEQFKPLDEEEGLEELGFASMLMRRLDGAVVRNSALPLGDSGEPRPG